MQNQSRFLPASRHYPGLRPFATRHTHAAPIARPKATALAVLGYLALIPALAHANCTTVGSTTTCDTSAPSPWTSTIGTGPTTASGSNVTVGTNAQIVVGDSSAIALSDNANIVVQSGALVQNGAVNSSGTYGTGGNTIDFRNNSTLTVEQGATVLSSGTQGSAEAVNPEGTGNTIVNNGTIRGVNSAAIWFQNTSGSNTVINNATGVIQAPGNVMGASGNGAVVFTNFGQVIGNLVFAGGNDTLNLKTGSTESGTINGGGGSNLLTLGGAGVDTLPTKITNFQTLQKTDSGTWTITNSLAGMGVTSTEVQQGTLVLTGANTSYAGTMLVDQPGTLRANAQSLPLAVTDNGLVQFQQDTAGAYTGLISGSGSVEKDGSGTLVLDGVNTYSGGTSVSAGTLVVGDASNPSASVVGPATVATGAVLGGYGAVNGDVTNNGTIAVANALSSAIAGAQGGFTINGTLTNAGLVQVGGSGPAGNTLTANNYVGNNGTIALNADLAGDNSISDKLVVNGGTATGSTTLKVTNVGGTGAPIVSNGIQVVQAINGATTDAGAFTLAGRFAKAGAYDYYLAKGGVTAGTSQDWFLRNTVPASTGSGAGSALVIPAAGTNLPAAGSSPITLYRSEVPLYAQIPNVMRELDWLQLDEFHLRQGDQMLLSEQGRLPAGWGRVWGAHSVLTESGDVSPQFDGSIGGAQVGQDIYADGAVGGHRNHYGFYLGMARATGEVSGTAAGIAGVDVGHLAINAYSLAGYWTHIGPSGWYTDTVVSGSSLAAETTSTDNVHATAHGTAVTASIEAGMPIAMGHALTIEPEAQVVYQHLSVGNLNDGVSNVGFDSGNTVLARFGLRFAGAWDALGVAWQPYMGFNVLHGFANGDHQTYDGVTSIATPVNQTTGRIDAGLVTKFSKHGSAFASVSWSTNLDGEHVRTIGGNAGVRWSW